ncbi:PREDICTED: VPS10 domain-containing receptor SorCS3, partial [Hipposideros armiger]|uniref:VPS10 domain-containing receptor SorCS3 n=1 Tax=Hipposideros armiger TaxID=186990 RepID=A0A8B7QVG5_HIPAR
MASRWPEEQATARRRAALGRQPGPEPLPQPGGGSGGKKQGDDGEPSLAGARWGQGIPAPGKPGRVRRRSRRAQPPSALERWDTGATALADGSTGSHPLAKGLREEMKALRAGGAAAEGLRLPSTSFALTGDSAHNQAMVHWSGHNSSVILILTKLYDFNLGSVTESSLWRSTNYGTTYEKLNDKVGLKTVLSYLYVNPTNKRKIMLLSDPEMESSILISSDEGATYQKYRLTFYIQSLLFHPRQEDWVLAYSLDQKLYSSMDFGRRWQLMHERITPNRFYWSVAGLDKEPDLVHMEARTADG